jgi:hypothetical protein
MEVVEVEDIDANHSHANKMDIDGTAVITSNIGDKFNLWDYMTKQQNEKAKCNICSIILSRKNGSTSGLRKHLYQVHKIEPFGFVSSKSQRKSYKLSVEEKKKLDSLVIKCVIQDGRSFSDMRQAGILKLFNHIIPGEKNKTYFMIFI